MSIDSLPPFAQKVINKLRRFEECTSDNQGADIGRQWFDLLTMLGLLSRVQRSPALWEITQQGEDLLEALHGEQPLTDSLKFEFLHPLTEERRTVSLTKAEVSGGMEDTLYEKLVAQFCQCESVGETNVVDCNCDEYGHDFELVSAV
ncbi:hypothetical protein [Pseudomonas sp. MWU12-2323]|uniref:hypothetical protein n=1 Tax=Pseudomonas sp. MWU12-2323 TaxID=2651296 RepID=UPI00128D0BB2|nr:hypothetical protein [Pseudomonas sp. MWU12-2323]MPQ71447.1 hypothetical protein [Pseudomonas sp. MWU12-2323]